MSAAIDALAGLTGAAYTGGDDYGAIGAMTDSDSVQNGIGANYFSGALQTLTSLGTGYLSKRLDIDLHSRLQGSQPLPRLTTTQNPIGGYGTVVRAQNGQQVAQLNLSLLAPIVLVGIVAYLIAKKGG